MEFTATKFNDAWLVKPTVLCDERGFFLESFVQKAFADRGIDDVFVQDNHSMSVHKGVLRGLHFQLPPFAQSKLVRVANGSVFDAIVDVRTASPTFGQWEGFRLSDDDFAMLYVPRGFAHGFCTLTEGASVLYKADNYFSPEHDSGIIWNDPDLAIEWPTEQPVLSDKDRDLPRFRDFVSPF